MKKFLLILAFVLFAPSAWAQCTGVFPPNTVCGNNTASPAPPAAVSSSSSSGITVGTTTVTAGTSGQCLSDNSGVVGNLPCSGGGGGINGLYDVTQNGWACDGTDHSTAALALLTTVYNAGGGILYFPPCSNTYRADSQLLIPFQNTPFPPTSVNIRFTGGNGGGTQSLSPGVSTLDLRYQSAAFSGTGSISSTTLTITAVTSGTLVVGSRIEATGLIGNYYIVALGTGTGGTGTYTLNQSGTVGGGSTIVGQDINAKIESRGQGLVEIDHLNITDGGANTNQTSFIHLVRGTPFIHDNRFNSNGNSLQDFIVLGGCNNQFDGSSGGAFQGYPARIIHNSFNLGWRSVVMYEAAFDGFVDGNWINNPAGVNSFESDGKCGPGATSGNFGTYWANNHIEMGGNMQYGVVLRATQQEYFNNTFDDPTSNTLSYYYLAAATGGGGGTSNNIIVMPFTSASSSKPLVTEDNHNGTGVQIANNSIESALQGSGPYENINTQIANGLIVSGPFAAANSQDTTETTGQIAVQDVFNPNVIMNFGINGGSGPFSGQAIIDAKNSGGSGRVLNMQPTGGPLDVTSLGFPRQSSTLSNGANNLHTNQTNWVQITGPTAAFSINSASFSTTGCGGGEPCDGAYMIIENTTSQAMTINNNVGTSGFLTFTGANLALTNNPGTATFVYDFNVHRWKLLSHT